MDWSRTINRTCTSLLTLGIIFSFLKFSGCQKPIDDQVDNPNEAKKNEHKLLSRAMYMIEPNRLGITLELDHAVSGLNDWSLAHGKKTGLTVEFKPETEKLLTVLLSADDMKKMSSELFDKRDVRHIRNSLLMRKIIKFAPGLSDNDLSRAVDLFYYTVRNIELIERPKESIPLPPFRIMLHGQGTAEDRAWIFAGLLRQLRIPAVILKPGLKDSSDKTDDSSSSVFLVGVLLDEKVYLFDTRLGLPIPGPEAAAETSPFIRKPATLAEFVSNPKIQAGLSTGSFKYFITPSSMKNPRVELIGHRSLWTTRMKRLNFSLVGKQKPVLFDELDDDSDGLIGRIAAFGKGRWSENDIAIWDYPENSLKMYEHPTEKQREEIVTMIAPFNAPISIQRDPKTKAIQIGVGKRLQLKSRIIHLAGQFQNAIKSYTSVIIDSQIAPNLLPELPEQSQRSLIFAQEDASFWSVLCKFEQRNYTSVENSLKNHHIARFPKGKRVNHARYLLAISYRHLGKFNAAVVILSDEIGKEHPQKHGFLLLANRWRRQNERQSKKKP
jgi:hypothetical protein